MLRKSILASAALAALISLPAAPSAFSQGDPKPGGEKEEGGKKPDAPEPKEESKETEGKAMIGGSEVTYQATAGTIPLTKKDGEPRASVFYVSYVRTQDGKPDPSRPLAICFNGGPGSSAVWLHLGALGPKRVDLQSEDGTKPGAPPFVAINNEWSILDVADLVFIDPVSTGFSRAEKGEDPKQFHGYNEDLESVGEFVRLYVTRHGRWASPKYLIGESYGGLRAAALSNHLQDRYGMYLNGVVLLSAVLDFETLQGGDLAYISFLPGFAATAAYHGQLAGDLNGKPADAAKQAREFALGDYASALLKGSALPEGQRVLIAKRFAGLTGLGEQFVLDSNLRVSPSAFFKELLRDENRITGRFDSRVTGTQPERAGSYPGYDPSYAIVYGAFSGAMNHYVRQELKFESDQPYEILSRAVHPWNYSGFTNRYVDASGQLASALTENPALRVLVCCGHTDLATPALGIEHSINHLPIDASLRGNITFQYYDAGHMMYTNLPDLKKLKEDLAAFLSKAPK